MWYLILQINFVISLKYSNLDIKILLDNFKHKLYEYIAFMEIKIFIHKYSATKASAQILYIAQCGWMTPYFSEILYKIMVQLRVNEFN